MFSQFSTPLTDLDQFFMLEALAQAKRAAFKNEVPVGAAIVIDGQVVVRAHNEVETLGNVLGHAELLAITRASASIKNWRLPSATLYVTLEPCQMCLGAIKLSRISKIVFGAWDPRQGALGSAGDFRFDPVMNREIEVVSGVLETQCSNVLKEFFKKRRNGLTSA